jgi:hypothetical protein
MPDTNRTQTKKPGGEKDGRSRVTDPSALLSAPALIEPCTKKGCGPSQTSCYLQIGIVDSQDDFGEIYQKKLKPPDWQRRENLLFCNTL